MKKWITTLFALVIVLNWSFGQSNSELEIIPENPGKPITLSIGHLYTSVDVTGYDGTSILVELYRGNGRSRIKNPPVRYTENNNEITLDHGLLTTKNLLFKLKVPRNTILDFHGSLASFFKVNDMQSDVTIKSNQADIEINNLVGNLEAKTFRGDIIVNNLEGSPLLETNNGDVTLNFVKLPEGYPNIVKSLYGAIKLYLDPNDKVTFRFRMNFNFEKIKSDFRFQLTNPNSFPMGVDSRTNFYRTINGGGTPIYIRQFKGSVEIISNARE